MLYKLLWDDLKKRYGVRLVAVARDDCWLPAGNKCGWPRSPWPANSCSCQRASSFSSRWLALGRFQRGQPRSRWSERMFTRSWTSLAFSQLELSPFAARRSHLRVPQEMGVGLAGAKGLQPHPSTLERSPRKAPSSVQRLRTPGARAPHNVRFAPVPAIRWPRLTPGSPDHALEPAPSVDPPPIGLFTPARPLALNSAQPATAGGHSHRPRCAKRVLAPRMSAFRHTIAILRPESWLTLARESGSLPGRDRHGGMGSDTV